MSSTGAVCPVTSGWFLSTRPVCNTGGGRGGMSLGPPPEPQHRYGTGGAGRGETEAQSPIGMQRAAMCPGTGCCVPPVAVVWDTKGGPVPVLGWVGWTPPPFTHTHTQGFRAGEKVVGGFLCHHSCPQEWGQLPRCANNPPGVPEPPTRWRYGGKAMQSRHHIPRPEHSPSPRPTPHTTHGGTRPSASVHLGQG